VHSPIGEIVEMCPLVVCRENDQRAGGAGARMENWWADGGEDKAI
jgi:hypothetical protein